MKKLLIVAITLLALTSCKKDTIKLNPVISDTTTDYIIKLDTVSGHMFGTKDAPLVYNNGFIYHKRYANASLNNNLDTFINSGWTLSLVWRTKQDGTIIDNITKVPYDGEVCYGIRNIWSKSGPRYKSYYF